MAKKLKVYGGMSFVDGKQVRTIVATTSKKRVVELTGNSLYYINDYWSITGNKLEVESALARPETMLYTKERVNPLYIAVGEDRL